MIVCLIRHFKALCNLVTRHFLVSILAVYWWCIKSGVNFAWSHLSTGTNKVFQNRKWRGADYLKLLITLTHTLFAYRNLWFGEIPMSNLEQMEVAGCCHILIKYTLLLPESMVRDSGEMAKKKYYFKSSAVRFLKFVGYLYIHFYFYVVAA